MAAKKFNSVITLMTRCFTPRLMKILTATDSRGVCRAQSNELLKHNAPWPICLTYRQNTRTHVRAHVRALTHSLSLSFSKPNHASIVTSYPFGPAPFRRTNRCAKFHKNVTVYKQTFFSQNATYPTESFRFTLFFVFPLFTPCPFEETCPKPSQTKAARQEESYNNNRLIRTLSRTF